MLNQLWNNKWIVAISLFVLLNIYVIVSIEQVKNGMNLKTQGIVNIFNDYDKTNGCLKMDEEHHIHNPQYMNCIESFSINNADKSMAHLFVLAWSKNIFDQFGSASIEPLISNLKSNFSSTEKEFKNDSSINHPFNLVWKVFYHKTLSQSNKMLVDKIQDTQDQLFAAFDHINQQH